MGKLLHFELDKLPRQRCLYICAIIAVGLTVLGALSIYALAQLMAAVSGAGGEIDLDSGMSGWVYMTGLISNSELNILMAIFVSIFVCQDASGDTLKNIFARGYGRGQVYVAKYLAALCGACILYVLAALTSLLIGAALWGFGSPEGCLLPLLCQLGVYVCYFSLFYVIAMLLGRIGLCVSITVAGPILLSLILSLIDAFLIREAFALSDYWFNSFFSVTREIGADGGALLQANGLAALYAALALTGGYFLYRRKQV